MQHSTFRPGNPSLRSSRRVAAGALLAAAVLVGLPACDSPSDSESPASLELISGSGQDGTVGAQLTNVLVVRVVDDDGQPVRNATVTWEAAAGAGSVSPASVLTDGSGLATARWTLGTEAGEDTATATVAGLAPVRFTATAAPGATTRVTAAPDTTVTTLGARVQLRALTADPYGNETGAEVQWTALDPSVAALEGEEAVAQGNGTARFVAAAGSAADTVRLTVRLDVARVAILPGALLLLPGETGTVTVQAFDAAGNAVSAEGIPLATSDPAVATVNAAARTVTVHAQGTATITAGTGALTAQATVLARPVTQIGPGCGLVSTGEAFCWGTSAAALVGKGPGFEPPVPITLVPGGLRFSQLTRGVLAPCGLTTTGQAYCWGFAGGPGAPAPDICPGNEPCARTPVPLSGGHTFTQLASAGYTNCGLRGDGVILCWGTFGQTPQPLTGGGPYGYVAGGGGRICALTTAGAVDCWSMGGASRTPFRVTPGPAFVSLSLTSSGDVCGLTAAGAAYCWGYDGFEQLGNGTGPIAPGFGPVAGGLAFTDLALGLHHGCGVTAAGAMYCWGYLAAAYFGAPSSGEACPVEPVSGCRSTPGQVQTPLTFTRISADEYQVCGVTPQGRAYCWGEMDPTFSGNLLQIRTTPVRVGGP